MNRRRFFASLLGVAVAPTMLPSGPASSVEIKIHVGSVYGDPGELVRLANCKMRSIIMQDWQEIQRYGAIVGDRRNEIEAVNAEYRRIGNG